MNNTLKSNETWRSWKFWLIVILLISSFTRFWKLGEIHEYVFDEVYHAFTAKMYALDRYEAWVWWESPPDGVAYEWTHPPLAKVIMSWGIELFGGPGELPSKVADPDVVQTQAEMDAEKKTDKILTPSAFGWRFFSALFGVIATFVLFLFTSSIFRNKWVGVFSAFLFTFDMLPLVQSRTAMNDIFAVTFILLSFYFFTKRKDLLDYHLSLPYWILTGLSFGAASASKWTSFFTLGILGLYHIGTIVYSLWKQDALKIKQTHWKKIASLLGSQLAYGVLFLLLIPYVVYMLSYWQMFTTRIYDYKGNSLAEIQTNKIWESERDTLRTELNNTEEQANKKETEKKLHEKERQIAFWSWLSSQNPRFADRYFIWWGVQKQMWWYHTNLNATHNYTSQWWTWPLDIRPVWFYVKYCTNPEDRSDPVCDKTYDATNNSKTIADIYTMGNPLIFWLIVPVILLLAFNLSSKYRVWFFALLPASIFIMADYVIRTASKARGETTISLSEHINQGLQTVVPQIFLFGMLMILFLTLVQLIDKLTTDGRHEDERTSVWHHFVYWKDVVPLVLCLLAFSGYWLPWARSPRIMFFYHFFPPVTFFYPLLAYCMYRVFSYSKNGRYVVLGYCLVVALTFAYFYPHVTGWQMPEIQREHYFWLQSWK